jgi:hypothetical protein
LRDFPPVFEGSINVPRSWSETNPQLRGVVRITSFQRVPCCVTKDNTFVVAIQYDYVAWTEQVAKAAEKMLNLKHGNEGYAGFALFTPVIFLREHGRNLRSVD